ncbi:MAG TPA: metal-sensitive transcriptional regulator [Tepidisphaeraceae bacterium]|jgi:DNA-binding FrmR family transcriptional regulator
MEQDLRDKAAKRLGRIAGQVAGLQKMVETDRYCIDVLTQIAAVRSALHAVGVEVLAGHVRHCVAGKGDGEHGKIDTDSLIEELRESLARFSK